MLFQLNKKLCLFTDKKKSCENFSLIIFHQIYHLHINLVNTKIKQKDKKKDLENKMSELRCIQVFYKLYKVLYYYNIMVIVINTNLTYITNRFSCIVIK